MKERRQLMFNALAAVAQVALLSAILYLLYRFLLRTVGLESLGVWSLVLSAATLARLADPGFAASVVRFVALHHARGNRDEISRVIQTATLSTAVSVGALLLIVWPLLPRLLGLVLQGAALQAAIQVYPYALLSLWCSALASVFQAGCDGLQRIHLRSGLLVGGELLHLILCYWLAPRFGLIGLGYARVIQGVVMLVAGWLLLRRLMNFLPLIPHRWHRATFSAMLGYGVNSQIVAVAMMLYDPTTKGLLANYGGPGLVAYFEMASRLIVNFRSIIISANQVLVPAIAGWRESRPEQLTAVYRRSYELVFYFGLPLYAGLIACAPLISEIWIGRYESHFVFDGIILAVAWFINTLNAPAYFANLGEGHLRWNTISHLIIGALNLLLGLLLGRLFGGTGVVIAWALALMTGSVMTSVSYHLEHRLSMWLLLPGAEMVGLICAALGAVISLVIYFQMRGASGPAVTGLAMVLTCALSLSIPLWISPARKLLTRWLSAELLKPAARA